jgi:hypothetical protein
MPAVTRVPLGADTFVHKWCVDINSASYVAPTWVGIFGTNDFVFQIEPSTEDDGDFDSVGWGSEVVTSRKWKAETTLLRKTTAASATVYDPGQELCRAAGFELGALNRVDVRIYEMTSGGPKAEAYRGYASVQWVPSGGDNKAIDKVKLTLSGSGELAKITHPDGAAVVPIVSSITPAVGIQAGATVHVIRGSGFMLAGVDNVVATSGVKFGATNATSWYTVSDNEIAVVAPAKAAGPFIIYVTNAVGISIGTAAVIQIT